MEAKLFRVILPVADIEEGARFYGKVLGSAGRRVSPGRHYFSCDGTILACYDAAADGDDVGFRPAPEPLYFAVQDLEATYEALKSAGGEIPRVDDHGQMGEIAVRPWGERSFYAKDPFGNPICFVDRKTLFTGE